MNDPLLFRHWANAMRVANLLAGQSGRRHRVRRVEWDLDPWRWQIVETAPRKRDMELRA